MGESFKDKTLGRDVIYCLLNETVIEGDGSTTKVLAGHLFAKIKVADTSSAIGTGTLYANIKLGKATMAQADITLASGDKVVDLGDPFELNSTGEMKYLVGFARSKSINYSKSTVDMTVDKDEFTDQRSDGLVAISGDINGYKLNCNESTSATFKLENMFIDIVVQNGTTTEGSTYEKSTPIVVLALIWQKTINAGGLVEIDVVPAQITSMGDSADYGSATTRNMSWTGCAKSEKGVIPTKCHVTTKAST